jgi:hypothetical protein
MLKTYVWMVILLGISWGGFVVLLARTLRKESARTKEKKNPTQPSQPGKN